MFAEAFIDSAAVVPIVTCMHHGDDDGDHGDGGGVDGGDHLHNHSSTLISIHHM